MLEVATIEPPTFLGLKMINVEKVMYHVVIDGDGRAS